MNTPTELAYLAGVLDSDGSIFITRATQQKRRVTHSYYLVVAIAQVQPQAIELFAASFGGKVRRNVQGRRRHSEITVGFKTVRLLPLYRWTLYSRQAAKCIEAVRPYIRIKRMQVEIAKRMAETIGDGSLITTNRGRRVRPEVVKLRTTLWEEMRTVNTENGSGHSSPQQIHL